MYEYKWSAASAAVVLLVATSGTAIAQTVSIGNVNQTTTNDVPIIEVGSITVNNVSGAGASVSLSAAGATSPVAATFINSVTNLEIGNVIQTSKQNPEAVPPATPTIRNAAVGGSTTGILVNDVSGDGATVQSSAIAAASQVSASFINAGGDVTSGNITQTTRSDPRRRILNDTGIGGVDGNYAVSGVGASVSVSATGAASSVSVLGIGQNLGTSLGDVEIGRVEQTTTHDFQKVHTNSSPIEDLRQVSGAGASAAISATGAQSSVSVARIGGTTDVTATTIGNITQTTRVTNKTEVINQGNIRAGPSLSGGITGDGASVSSSAAGVISSVSISSIDTLGSTRVDIGRIDQTTTNTVFIDMLGDNISEVTNNARLEGSATAHVSGHGASASVSASGAVSAVSVSSIDSASPRPNSGVGNINQRTINNAVVTNNVGGGFAPDTMTLGNISGTGASASLSASGATSVVGFSSIENTASAGNPSINVGNITQRTVNNAAVTNQGASLALAPAIITVGNITGNGASASINASGAVSQVSIASINDAKVTTTAIGNIAQTTNNTAPVINGGIINGGNVMGAGASTAIGAVGGTSVISVSVIH